MKLPRIYEFFVPGQIVTFDEMKAALGTDGNTLRQRLSKLGAEGYLVPIRQGLYVINWAANRTGPDADTVRCSPFAIASQLTKSATLGFGSALRFHAGLSPHEDEPLVVCSESSFKAFTFQSFQYIHCKLPRHAWTAASGELPSRTQLEIYDSRFAANFIRVTALEQTLVDCLARPLYCKSLGELVRLARHIAKIPDPRFVIAAAMRWDSTPVLHRLGLFTELLKNHWPELYQQVADTVRPELSPKPQAWPLLGSPQDEQATSLETAKLDALRRSWRIQFCELNKQL
jgi:predicted transcriptional regulator of viral defense system